MNLVNLNAMSDHVYKKVYDLDVYFTPDNDKVVANVIVFPEKYLEGSPLYSEKYFNILSNDYKLDKIIYNTASYYGYNKNKISNVKFTVSKVWGDYLTNYVKEAEDLLYQLYEVNDLKISDLKKSIFLFNFRGESHLSVTLDYSWERNPGSEGYVDRDEVFDYWKENMSYIHPNIDVTAFPEYKGLY